MKKLTLLVTVLIIVEFATAQITFQKIFGSIAQDGGYSVIQTEDSGYVFTGNWCYGGGFCKDYMFLIKTDQYGNTVWTKYFPSAGFAGTAGTVGYSLVKTSDGGFAIGGYNILYGSGLNFQFYLVKTNSSGDTLWTKTYGWNYTDMAYSVTQTSDSGFILTGYSDAVGGYRLSVVRTDANGDSLWSKTYVNAMSTTGISSIGHSVLEVDAGFIILGFTIESNGSGNNDIYLIKTNSVGDTIWTKAYSEWNDDQGYCIQKTQDNGFIISGATFSFGAGGYDAYLLKTDSNGVELWHKTYGGLDNEYANYISLTSDGGYVITGSTQSLSTGGDYDVYLIKTDSLGNQQWYKTFGGINADYGYSVQPTFDGGYIIVGLRGDNIYLIKTDGNGNLTSTNEINPSELFFQVNIYPNPFSSSTTIMTNKNLQNATLIIYNTLGQEMKSIRNIYGHEIKLQRDNLPDAIYFIHLMQDNETIVKEKLKIY